MKKIEAFLREEALQAVKEALRSIGIVGMNVHEVHGHGRQGGIQLSWRGTPYQMDLLPKIQLNIFLSDHNVEKTIDAIVNRTANGGAEIVKYLKTGSAYYAPSAAAVEMAESILKDKKKVLPCAAYLEGEYGIDKVFVGVPCKLGARGLVEVLQLNLAVDERIELQKSASAVRELSAALK